MPDINLLDNTKVPGSGQDKRPKRVPPAPVEFSRPELQGSSEHPLKKPSSFNLWVKSLFRGRLSPKRASSPPPPEQPRRTRGQAEAPPAPPGVEDIFADIPSFSGGPRKNGARAQPRAAQLPGGPKPGEFPPLPVVPPFRPSSRPTQTPSARPRPVTIPQPPAARPFRSVPPAAPPAPRLNIPPFSRVRSAPPAAEQDRGGVNLLPEELVDIFDLRKRLTTIGLVAVAALLVVGIVYVSLLLWEETQVRKTDEKKLATQEVLLKLSALRKEQQQGILLKASNDVIRQLLNKHVYWTKFFDKFEQHTLPTVYYQSGITTDLSGTLSLTGVAPDVATIIEQLAVYRAASDFLSSVNIDNITRVEDEQNYNFIVDFKFVPDIYYRPIDLASAAPSGTAPVNANVNSNTNAVP